MIQEQEQSVKEQSEEPLEEMSTNLEIELRDFGKSFLDSEGRNLRNKARKEKKKQI